MRAKRTFPSMVPIGRQSDPRLFAVDRIWAHAKGGLKHNPAKSWTDSVVLEQDGPYDVPAALTSGRPTKVFQLFKRRADQACWNQRRPRRRVPLRGLAVVHAHLADGFDTVWQQRSMGFAPGEPGILIVTTAVPGQISSDIGGVI
ncbi:hypothetical protein [Rhizobium binae]|uniref:hypothetical protein n=1 Tax=Rhizobium binae TaxID=1138190 RepID=UPI001A980CA4|nr:hypothetical protein [Rhizobium binae]MBX4927525.1 hypothetical protein [Rhizobium binae]MBX4970605.1 hypothetical protein [Rhizobium binae]MBX4991099.1 hypothetical protein [Rhizobium binae]QSY81861.1 hypothetical protein J2J99_19830 [Rhizobium binae]